MLQVSLVSLRGVKAVTVSGYWQKLLTVTTLAVIKCFNDTNKTLKLRDRESQRERGDDRETVQR
jgi:hypothetical protein